MLKAWVFMLSYRIKVQYFDETFPDNSNIDLICEFATCCLLCLLLCEREKWRKKTKKKFIHTDV